MDIKVYDRLGHPIVEGGKQTLVRINGIQSLVASDAYLNSLEYIGDAEATLKAFETMDPVQRDLAFKLAMILSNAQLTPNDDGVSITLDILPAPRRELGVIQRNDAKATLLARMRDLATFIKTIYDPEDEMHDNIADHIEEIEDDFSDRSVLGIIALGVDLDSIDSDDVNVRYARHAYREYLAAAGTIQLREPDPGASVGRGLILDYDFTRDVVVTEEQFTLENTDI